MYHHGRWPAAPGPVSSSTGRRESGRLGTGSVMTSEMVEETSEAFTAFYRDEFEAQVRRAWLLLGSAERAHDVVQESFAAVYQRWTDIADPGPYLNRVVLNGCRAAGRRAARETVIELDPDPAPFDGDAVEMAELLLTLAFVPRAAIVLKFYVGLRESEIGELLGIRTGSVGPAVTRGLRKLRGVLS